MQTEFPFHAGDSCLTPAIKALRTNERTPLSPMQRSPRPQDISWFLDAHGNGQLNLDPPYQRKSVWTPKDRRYFLDTIFQNFPSPAIFLHKEIKDGKTIYNVVDGKQRLETILKFAAGEIALAKDFGDARLAGKKWVQIPDESRRVFWNYVLPVEQIDFTDPTTLTEAFNRLNRNARKLERQEIRHSQYDGWLMNFVETEADEPVWKELGIITTARVRRMTDHQFLSELILVVLEEKIHGFDQDHLDEKYAGYNDLEEAGLLTEEETLRTRFAEARDFILQIERCNKAVTTYGTTVTAFYTLWAWAVLRRTPNHVAADVATVYAAFMSEVSRASKDHGITEVAAPFALVDVASYAANSRGASTDLGPRQARLDILATVLA